MSSSESRSSVKPSLSESTAGTKMIAPGGGGGAGVVGGGVEGVGVVVGAAVVVVCSKLPT